MASQRSYLALFSLVILLGVLSWAYLGPGDLGEGQYVVEDPRGDRMVVEVAEGLASRAELDQMYLTGESRWIGGQIAESGGKYGFAFDPQTIVVAEITAEGLQAVYYEEIAANISYWKGLGTVYITGIVVQKPR